MSDAKILIETPDYTNLKDNFVDELRLASKGEPSSLSFIKHLLPKKPLLSHGIVQGIVIGGTNYIVSTERIEPTGKHTTLKRKVGLLPIFTNRQTLVNFLHEHLDERADAIGVNFGFEMKPLYGKNGCLDGYIQASGTKEHTFTGITESVGTLVQTTFFEKYKKNIHVTVANDTICLLLSSNGTEQVSLIVGTGINMGLRLKEQQTTLINLEAGNFDKFSSFSILKQIDERTKNPGKKLFEKCVSGKYLHEHFNLLIEEFGLTTPPIATGLELNALSNNKIDKDVMHLSKQIITRSAEMVASAIAGVYIFFDQPKTLEIIGDGSLLWNGWEYQTTIKKQLQAFGIAENAISIQRIEESSIKGAIGLITNS